MKTTTVILLAVLTQLAQAETKAPSTTAGVVLNFIQEVSALATNHLELADFPQYVKQRKAEVPVDFRKEIKPFSASFDKNITPVFTKRRIRPSDCGIYGIYLQFSLVDDGGEQPEAPLDTITYFPCLKSTLYAEVVLWDKASPELKKKLEDIIGRHKAMLRELDKKAAPQAPKELGRAVATCLISNDLVSVRTHFTQLVSQTGIAEKTSSSSNAIPAEIISSWGRQEEFFRKGNYTILEWNQAEVLLREKSHIGGKQYHTGWLTIYTSDGKKYLTKQPKIDFFFEFMKRNNLNDEGFGTE